MLFGLSQTEQVKKDLVLVEMIKKGRGRVYEDDKRDLNYDRRIDML
jgi:hypothetical protein